MTLNNYVVCEIHSNYPMIFSNVSGICMPLKKCKRTDEELATADKKEIAQEIKDQASRKVNSKWSYKLLSVAVSLN